MKRYYRRIGKRNWREISPDEFEETIRTAQTTPLPARVTFAEVDLRRHVMICASAAGGQLQVCADGVMLYMDRFERNELAYGHAIQRAHEWCEQRGYVVADVRLDG